MSFCTHARQIVVLSWRSTTYVSDVDERRRMAAVVVVMFLRSLPFVRRHELKSSLRPQKHLPGQELFEKEREREGEEDADEWTASIHVEPLTFGERQKKKANETTENEKRI